MIRKSGNRFSEKIMLIQKDMVKPDSTPVESGCSARPAVCLILLAFSSSASADRSPDPGLRTLQSRAGAGSYGALSRPAENVFECMRHRRALRPEMSAKNAPVAQLDRALDYESRGQEFESLRARQ